MSARARHSLRNYKSKTHSIAMSREMNREYTAAKKSLWAPGVGRRGNVWREIQTVTKAWRNFWIPRFLLDSWEAAILLNDQEYRHWRDYSDPRKVGAIDSPFPQLLMKTFHFVEVMGNYLLLPLYFRGSSHLATSRNGKWLGHLQCMMGIWPGIRAPNF